MMAELAAWTPRAMPARIAHLGRFVRLEPIDPARHGKLANVLAAPETASQYEFLWDLPPKDEAEARAWIAQAAATADPLFFAVIDARTDEPQGRLALMRIEPKHGVAEIGSILYAPALQRSPATTEVIFLLGSYLFEALGYRRFEWKCDSRNARSKRAAQRFGFQFEGLFRQHMVIKGQNRDTAWFSILDQEWPALRRALAAWLDPSNFDAAGRQRQSLSAFQGDAVRQPR